MNWTIHLCVFLSFYLSPSFGVTIFYGKSGTCQLLSARSRSLSLRPSLSVSVSVSHILCPEIFASAVPFEYARHCSGYSCNETLSKPISIKLNVVSLVTLVFILFCLWTLWSAQWIFIKKHAPRPEAEESFFHNSLLWCPRPAESYPRRATSRHELCRVHRSKPCNRSKVNYMWNTAIRFGTRSISTITRKNRSAVPTSSSFPRALGSRRLEHGLVYALIVLIMSISFSSWVTSLRCGSVVAHLLTTSVSRLQIASENMHLYGSFCPDARSCQHAFVNRISHIMPNDILRTSCEKMCSFIIIFHARMKIDWYRFRVVMFSLTSLCLLGVVRSDDPQRMRLMVQKIYSIDKLPMVICYY